MFMKKEYEQPFIYSINLEYDCLLTENSGELGDHGDDYEAKHNNLIFDDIDDPWVDLWGDYSDED